MDAMLSTEFPVNTSSMVDYEVRVDEDYDDLLFYFTRQMFDDFTFVVRFILLPISGIIGGIGNLYGLKVLNQDSKSQKNNFFFYMYALFIENFIQCVNNVVYNFPYQVERYDSTLGVTIESFLNLPSIYVTKVLGHFAAVLLIQMSVERLFSLLQPFSFSTYLIFKHPKRVTLFSLIFFCITLIPYPLCCVPTSISKDNSTVAFALVERPWMREFMEQYVFYQNVLLSVFLPIIILVLNSSIPVAYYRYTKSNNTMQLDSKRRQQQLRITALTLSTAISFFILSLPNLMAFTLDFIDNKYNYFGEYNYYFHFFIILARLFTNVNAIFDSIVYILLSSSLCDTIKRFCCGSTTEKDDSNDNITNAKITENTTA